MKRSVGLRCTICNHPARPQMLRRDNSRLSRLKLSSYYRPSTCLAGAAKSAVAAMTRGSRSVARRLAFQSLGRRQYREHRQEIMLALFIGGKNSREIRRNLPNAAEFFPSLRVRSIAGAGSLGPRRMALRRWLIPLSQVNQHLGLPGPIRSGAGV